MTQQVHHSSTKALYPQKKLNPRLPIKILFFSAHTVHNQSAMAGNQTFNYYLKRFAADESFEVGYVVAHKNDADYNRMQQQFAGCKNFSVKMPLHVRLYNYLHYAKGFKKMLARLYAPYYYVNPLYVRPFIKAAKNIRRQCLPQVVVLEWTEMLFLYPKLRRLFPQAKFVCSEHDVAFISIERLAQAGVVHALLAQRFKACELRLLKALDIVVPHNRLDALRLQQNGIRQEQLVVISPYFGNYLKHPDQKRYTNNILFFGAMGRDENIQAVTWFINQVFVPFKLYEQFSFTVVGGKGNLLQPAFAHVPNLQFTGFVQDPSPYFEAALCMVAPIFNGAGIKVKTIEGMQAALPVLTTQAGIDGIDAVDGESFFLCETPAAYHNALLRLGANLQLAATMGNQARNFIETHFSYERTYQDYKQKILDVL